MVGASCVDYFSDFYPFVIDLQSGEPEPANGVNSNLPTCRGS